MKRRLWAAGVLGALALTLAACGSSSTISAPHIASNQITTASTSIGTVLVNSQGRTLYWFSIDTPTKSNCTGGCLSFWPPVPGPITTAPGVTLMHGFGTITRSDGSVQATYDGHPLYIFSGDSAPGDTKGNKFNGSGGLWWAMTPSGAKATAAAPKPKPKSSSSGGGGGGYY